MLRAGDRHALADLVRNLLGYGLRHTNLDLNLDLLRNRHANLGGHLRRNHLADGVRNLLDNLFLDHAADLDRNFDRLAFPNRLADGVRNLLGVAFLHHVAGADSFLNRLALTNICKPCKEPVAVWHSFTMWQVRIVFCCTVLHSGTILQTV